MNYAIVENSIVVNVIVGPLPVGMEGVPVEGLDVTIGDHYENGVFTRAESPLLTDADRIAALEAENTELTAALASVEEALNG